MSETTTIEWTRNDDGTPGRTWNPVTGCTKISAGCDMCYAETIAERFRGHAAFPNGFDIQIRHNKMNDPLTWRKPTRVFVNSMSDLFHDQIHKEEIAWIFAVMATARRHTFQLLTKRHGRMRSLLNDPNFAHKVRHRAEVNMGLNRDDFVWPLPNLWLGVSVENQQWADTRIRPLMQTPAAVRFLSCEPLLGPIQLHRGHAHCPTHDFPGGFCMGDCPDIITADWLIDGGESGRKARPAHPDWYRSLRDQSEKYGIAYFHKQNGEWADRTQLTADQRATASVWDEKRVLYVHPDDGRTQTHGEWDTGDHAEGWACVQRVGKKAAGRLLDGREHNDFPAVAQ